MFSDDQFDPNERQGITLRLNYEERCLVHSLRALTGEATQSRAIMTAVERYPRMLKRIEELEEGSRLRKLERVLQDMLYASDQVQGAQAEMDKAHQRTREVLTYCDEPVPTCAECGGELVEQELPDHIRPEPGPRPLECVTCGTEYHFSGDA